MKLNNKGFAISGVIYAIMFLFIILTFATLGLLGSRKVVLDSYKQDVMKTIEGDTSIINVSKIDRSGAPSPILASSMIPVVYDGANWIKAEYISDYDQNWYNYEEKKWANAVIVKDAVRESYNNINVGDTINSEDIQAFYVWIPRFSYKLFNADYSNLTSEPSLIDISFENVDVLKSINSLNGEYLTHPAFTFGSDEISGFWVSKFEATGALDNISFLPNLSPILNYSVKSINNAVINSTNLGLGTSDIHVLKNSEWAAIAYLSHSIYGQGNNEIVKNGYNKNSSFKTGCGASVNTCESSFGGSIIYPQSTTGNIYGIFDLSGGANEYVMAVMTDVNNSPMYLDSGYDASSMPNSKYYDVYSYIEDSSSADAYRYGSLGSATKEVWGWYSNSSTLVDSTSSWQLRGGASTQANTGIFAFDKATGEALQNVSFRTAIIPQ